MRAKCAFALVPLLVACGVTAGCSSGSVTVARVSDVLNCGRVVDQDSTGYLDGPLTVGRAIALLTELQRANGTARIAQGRLSRVDLKTLDMMAVELLGYSGSKLSDDAATFAVDELSYSPSSGAVDTSYARPLVGDIAALERDCPASRALGGAAGLIIPLMRN